MHFVQRLGNFGRFFSPKLSNCVSPVEVEPQFNGVLLGLSQVGTLNLFNSNSMVSPIL
jgi:hypothetical protein